MDSKDLMSLISEEISELSLLCGGMSEMERVPSSVLSLARNKATLLLQRIDQLDSYQKAQVPTPECEVRPNVPASRPVSVEVEPELSMTTHPEPVKETPVTAVAEEEPVEVVDKVEYHQEKNLSKEEVVAPIEPVSVVSDAPQEKHEPINHQETKPLAHEYGNVRTVLDANRSAKRVESRFVQSIKKAITLNDRIRYMNELFGGDAQLMSSTIEQLDGMSSLQEAKDYVKWNFSWDENEEAASDFLRLLEDRFS